MKPSHIRRSHIKRLSRVDVLGFAATAVVVMALAGAAWACTKQAAITLDPEAGPAGSTLIVNGRAFNPGIPVDIHWNDDDGVLIGNARPNSDGVFYASLVVPASSPGTYTIFAVQRDPATGTALGVGRDSFQVTRASGSNPGQANQPGVGESTSGSTSGASGAGGGGGQAGGSTAASTSGAPGADGGQAGGSTSAAASGAPSRGNAGTTGRAGQGAPSRVAAPANQGDSPGRGQAGHRQALSGSRGPQTIGARDPSVSAPTLHRRAAPQRGMVESGPRVSGPTENDRGDDSGQSRPGLTAQAVNGDLWAAFDASAPSRGSSLTAGAQSPVGDRANLALGAGLAGGGLLVLFGAVFAFELRRRTAKSRRALTRR